MSDLDPTDWEIILQAKMLFRCLVLQNHVKSQAPCFKFEIKGASDSGSVYRALCSDEPHMTNAADLGGS